MRRHSIVGPLILILIGVLFLVNNMRPDMPLADIVAVYWPFLLIAWGAIRLVEVLWSFFQGRPVRQGMGGGEVVLVVFICLFGTGLFSAHRHGFRFGVRGLEMFGQPFEFGVSKQQAVPPDSGRVVVDNLRGNLRVTGGDGSEIRITGRKTIRALSRAEAERADGNTPVEITVEGGNLVVRTNHDRLNNNQRITEDLEITLPRRSNLEVRSRGGEYEITDLAGSVEISSDRSDSVRLSKIGGNARVDVRRSDLVRAVDVKGDVDLQGRGTDIELANVAGQVVISGSYGGNLEFKNLAKPLHLEFHNTDLRVEALPGQISMDLGEFTARNVVGPMRLITKSRDVRIAEFTQSLELETERGDIELQPGRLPLAKIDARSRAGRIEITLPGKANFQLQAATEHGDAINEYGPPIEKETDGRSASLKGNVGQGPSIHLITERGSVSVRKAGISAAQAEL